MDRKSELKRVMSVVGTFILISVVVYGFLTFMNWSPKFQDWNGFSRFIIGSIGIIFLIRLFDELFI